MAGLFLSLDGLDGTGKSTQGRMLAEWLRAGGREVTECRDPGGTLLGDQFRAFLLDKNCVMTPATEAFLFMASRAELVHQVIRPALAAGHVVVCDRFLLATVVYQGHAGGLNVETLWKMGELATGGLEPDLTLVFDLPVEVAARRRGRDADRMESRDRMYHERVRQGFLMEAKLQSESIHVIDASTDPNVIQSQVRAIVEPILREVK
jgi:dTMP kinase